MTDQSSDFLSATDKDAMLAALGQRSGAVMQARMANALLLLNDGLSIEDVAGLLFLDEKAVGSWLAAFQMRGQQEADQREKVA